MSIFIQVNQDELTVLQKKYDKNARYCSCCGKSIWYGTLKISDNYDRIGHLTYSSGTSYKTHKIIDGTKYEIQLCQNCLKEKDPEYDNIKNFSKVFNTLNKHVHYAFDVPTEDLHKARQKQVPTLENMIRNHGEELGKQKWEEYKRKQAETNSFEYKKEKYGWDEERFKEYNKSRAVTKENLIRKYGDNIGNKKYDEYVAKQKITKAKDYVVSKYGLLYWENLCGVKGLAKEAYVEKYGENIGLQKYEERLKQYKESNFKKYSVVSNLFFNSLILENKDLFRNLTIYYAGNENDEYCMRTGIGYKYLDFYLKEIKLDIEFFGDYWHCNPSKYTSNYYHENIGQYAEDIWKKDKERIDDIKKCGIETFVIWESEKDDINKIQEIINIIKDRKNKYGIL